MWNSSPEGKWRYRLISDAKDQPQYVQFERAGMAGRRFTANISQGWAAFDWRELPRDAFFELFAEAEANAGDEPAAVLKGLEIAKELAEKTARGKIAAAAINREITTRILKNERK